MPHVNEEMLEHNLKDECGITKMWEDEQINIKMRDMRISEGGIMSYQKSQAFNLEFTEATSSVLDLKQSLTLEEN